MNTKVILDTGPLVAFLDGSESHHAWCKKRFRGFAAPLYTCEPVITEALFLLRRAPPGQEVLLELLARQAILIDFRLTDHIEAVRRLQRAYRDLPISLADACLVCMAESTRLPICTLDSHFTLYRTRRGLPLAVIMPAPQA